MMPNRSGDSVINRHESYVDVTILSFLRWWLKYMAHQCVPASAMPYRGLMTTMIMPFG